MDKKQEKHILRLAKAGAKEFDICKKVGFSRSTVRNLLNKNGIKLRDFRTYVMRDKIIEDFSKTNDIGLTAKRLKVTYSKAYYYISRFKLGKA